MLLTFKFNGLALVCEKKTHTKTEYCWQLLVCPEATPVCWTVIYTSLNLSKEMKL